MIIKSALGSFEVLFLLDGLGTSRLLSLLCNRRPFVLGEREMA